jgi:SNF family Na+-dependent transporter
LIAEIVIGRKTHLNPSGAYRQLGKTKRWGRLGLLSIATGFIVSSFYSVICGWTLGYLIDAVTSQLTNLHSIAESQNYFNPREFSLLGDSHPLLVHVFGYVDFICGSSKRDRGIK